MSLSATSDQPLRQRFRPLGWLGVTYLLIGAATRIVLLAMPGAGGRGAGPGGLGMGLIGLLALAIVWLSRRWLRTVDAGSRFLGRGNVVLGWLVLTVVSVLAVSGPMKDRSNNMYVNELAGNGIYQFFNAFRSSLLGYSRIYRTLPEQTANERVRKGRQTPDATYIGND